MRRCTLALALVGRTSGFDPRLARVLQHAWRPALRGAVLSPATASATGAATAAAAAAHGRCRSPVLFFGGDDDERRKLRRNEIWLTKSWRALLVNLVTAVFILFWARSFAAEPYFIPSGSMYPTLRAGDQVAVEKFSNRYSPPSRGDLIVFSPPPAYYALAGQPPPPTDQWPWERKRLVKRVVAVAGDSVEVQEDGVLRRNGRPVYEPYTLQKARYTLQPLVVPAGCVFVLGDNRNLSVDSHVWGPLPLENLVGKAFYIIWPVRRQGFVDELMQDLEITNDSGIFIERVEENIRSRGEYARLRSTR